MKTKKLPEPQVRQIKCGIGLPEEQQIVEIAIGGAYGNPRDRVVRLDAGDGILGHLLTREAARELGKALLDITEDPE